MSDFNPGQTLPGKVEKVSVQELTKNLTEADEQAKALAKKASNVYRKLHPEDTIKTDVYDASDFIDKEHHVFIPQEVEQMFQEFENKKIQEKEERATTKEEIQNALKKEEGSVIPEEKVKKNPVFDKLMASFGLSDKATPKTISHTINGLKITFEYPSSMITNFALAYASSEGIGTLDFGFNMQLMTLALSVVEIDDVPVTTALNISDAYEKYSDIPSKVRKVCGIRMVEFFRSINDKDLEKFMTFYSDEIGFNEDKEASVNSDEFVEMKCPTCGRTELIAVVDGKTIPKRFCRDDGAEMEAQSSNKTDENGPLA
jgi:hypothetical protein